MNTTLIYAVKRANILINHPSDIRRKYYTRPYYTPKQYPNNCRYKNVRRLKDEKTGKVFHETVPQIFITQSDEDVYYTVTNETKDRLDIIANEYYGTAKYWWVIAQANYIIDPFDVPVRNTIKNSSNYVFICKWRCVKWQLII